jgi:hypothetical protein
MKGFYTGLGQIGSPNNNLYYLHIYRKADSANTEVRVTLCANRLFSLRHTRYRQGVISKRVFLPHLLIVSYLYLYFANFRNRHLVEKNYVLPQMQV